MPNAMPFGEVLEAADRLPLDEQRELVAILQRRLALAGRQRVIADVKEADREFAEGRCKPATTAEIMREILK